MYFSFHLCLKDAAPPVKGDAAAQQGPADHNAANRPLWLNKAELWRACGEPGVILQVLCSQIVTSKQDCSSSAAPARLRTRKRLISF
jgi:hypothetical protein